MRSIKKRIDQLERIAGPVEEYVVTITRTIISPDGNEQSTARMVAVKELNA